MGVITDSTCILCQNGEGRGNWQLCPRCRAEIADRSARRQAAMAPSYCMGCLTPKQTLPAAGEIYCPHCRRRFGKGALDGFGERAIMARGGMRATRA